MFNTGCRNNDIKYFPGKRQFRITRYYNIHTTSCGQIDTEIMTPHWTEVTQRPIYVDRPDVQDKIPVSDIALKKEPSDFVGGVVHYLYLRAMVRVVPANGSGVYQLRA